MVTLNIRYVVLYAIFTFLTVNSLCNQNFLNCNTGVSLFFQYTSVAFNLSILTTLLAVMLYKGIVMPTAVIILIALLQQTGIQADRFVNTSLVNIGLMNPLGQYHPPMFFAASFILVYKMLNQKKFYLTLPTNLLLISLVLSGWWANQELF